MRRFMLLFIFLSLVDSVPLPPLQVRNNQIYANNKPIEIKGINWFGFNNKQTMVDGLWAGGTSFATDFSTIIYKIKLLGFNTVRLPFTFSDMNLPTKSFRIPCVYTNKTYAHDKTRKTTQGLLPGIVHPSTQKGVCNSYIPSYQQTKDRFVWTVSFMINSGLYVILDYHPMGTENIPYNPSSYHKNWEDLWLSIIKNTNNKGRIILDLLNEPDSMKFKWPYVTSLYIPVMNNIYMRDPKTLFMVEGTAQIGYHLNWGDGFVTKADIIAQYKIDDATPFFKELMKHHFRNNLIISPHLYGPSISKSIVYKGPALFNRLYNSFAYLYHEGFCFNGHCKKFPIVIGEIGSMFADPKDIEFLNDFAKFQDTKMGKHKHNNWVWWAYNENSGDTGGIVKNNWQDLDWQKLGWLQSSLHL